MNQRDLRFSKVLLRCFLAGGATLLMAGCDLSSSGSGNSAPLRGGQNSIPQISGTPPTSISVGTAYSFQPSAYDPDGDDLTFSIQNQPGWTSFNAANGRLTGTPSTADVGTYNNITIRVSDGIETVLLSKFSIGVTQIGTGSATISWLPPTQNTDGTQLTDLAGFRIYYGTSIGAMTQTVNVTNSGLTSYVIEYLGAATWYFTVRAYATDGAESPPSNIASKIIE